MNPFAKAQREGKAEKQTEMIQFMPLYEYELCEGECNVCGGKFTLNRPFPARPRSISDAKKAGFTVLKKISKDEYEKQ
jgi:hypothetical protein